MSRQRDVTLADMGLIQAKVVFLTFTLEATDELSPELLKERLARLPYGHGAKQMLSERVVGPRGNVVWRYHFTVENP